MPFKKIVDELTNENYAAALEACKKIDFEYRENIEFQYFQAIALKNTGNVIASAEICLKIISLIETSLLSANEYKYLNAPLNAILEELIANLVIFGKKSKESNCVLSVLMKCVIICSKSVDFQLNATSLICICTHFIDSGKSKEAAIVANILVSRYSDLVLQQFQIFLRLEDSGLNDIAMSKNLARKAIKYLRDFVPNIYA